MLEIQGRKYASVTVCDVTLYDRNTKYPVMYFDTLKMASIEGSAEVTDIQGGQGNSVLASISHTKTINVQFDDAIMTMSSLALLTGGELREAGDGNKAATVVMVESELLEGVKVADGKFDLSKTAREGCHVYAGLVIDGVLSTVARTKSALEEASKEIPFASFENLNTQDGTYRLFYESEYKFDETYTATELKVIADKFAGAYRFIGDTVLYNQRNGKNDIFQIEIPKLQLDNTFSMTFNAATEAMVFSFKGKALRDDNENMIIFRQIKDSASNTTGEDETVEKQYDGEHKYPALPVLDIEDPLQLGEEQYISTLSI